MTWLAVVLALGVTLPSLRIGLLLDDHVIARLIDARLAGAPGEWWNLFDLVGRKDPYEVALRIENGSLPWWTWPELSLAFFRPLSAATHCLDQLLWPDVPLLMHAQNLLWYGLLVFLVARIYRHVMGAGIAAMLALLFYAIDDAHSAGTAWIASRNTLLSAVGAALTFVLYLRARREAWRAGAWLAPLALALALASGEGAIAVFAYLIPYALFLDHGRARERLVALLPLLAVTAVWTLVYRGLGYGAHGSGIYRDPWNDPTYFFLHRVPEILPELLYEQFAIAAWTHRILPGLAHPAVRWSSLVVGALTLVFVLRLAWLRKDVAFWLVALVLSALPVCGTTGPALMPRLFFVTGIAAFALLAETLVALLAMTTGRTLVTRVACVALALPWFVVHGPFTLALAPRAHTVALGFEADFQREAESLPHDLSGTVLVLNTPNTFMTTLSPAYRPANAPPLELRVLGESRNVVRLHRVTPSAFVLEPAGGYLLGPYAHFLRAPERRFQRGQRVLAGGMQVQVEEITSDGRPARVRFELPASDVQQQVWIYRTPRGYERLRWPAVGESVELPGN